MVLAGLLACSGGIEVSVSEIRFEVPQEGDAQQRAIVQVDNLYGYPVRIAGTDNGPTSAAPIRVVGAIASIDAESTGEWGFAASLGDYLEVGERFTYTLSTQAYRCETEDLDACLADKSEEYPLESLTMIVTAEIVPVE